MKMFKELKKHENYKELIWVLAKTDFKLRYQGSVLGYIWAILSPLLLFLVLNFVFTSIFAQAAGRGGPNHYSLQLLVALMLFGFFSEGTTSAMNSLNSKQQLVTKIYIPRWTIIVASTINASMIYIANLLVIIAFFAWYHFLPSFFSFVLFLFFSAVMYIIIVSFGLITAPLILRFKDIGMIWAALLSMLFYATPIFYPLTMLPEWSHKWILLNPVAFIIHFTKESMFEGHYADPIQYALFLSIVAAGFLFSIWVYKKAEPKIAEYL